MATYPPWTPEAEIERYTVHGHVWAAAGMPPGEDDQGPGNYLCIACLEKRLGRILTREDFTDSPVNSTGAQLAQSPLLEV